MQKFCFLLLSACCCLSAFSSPVRSNLGGDGEEYVDAAAPTAADYVQDGLVAMWDAIENVGWGIHSDCAQVWVDLVGGCVTEPKILWSNGEGRDYISVDVENVTLLPDSALGFSNAVWQVEVAFTSRKTGDNNILLTFDTGAYFGIQGGNRFANVRDGEGRLGWVCSNLKAWVYSDVEVPYSEAVSGVMSMRHDSETKRNNRYYWNAVYRNYFLYANETKLSGVFYIHVPRLDRPKGVETHYHCIRLYDRFLTEEEISYNYTIDKMRFGL